MTVLRLVGEGKKVVDWRVNDVGLYWDVDAVSPGIIGVAFLALIEVVVWATSELWCISPQTKLIC